jgi:hypothetical protein
MLEDVTQEDEDARELAYREWAKDEINKGPSRGRATLAYDVGWEAARCHYQGDIRLLRNALEDAVKWLKRAMTLTIGDDRKYKQYKDAMKRAREAAKKGLK